MTLAGCRGEWLSVSRGGGINERAIARHNRREIAGACALLPLRLAGYQGGKFDLSFIRLLAALLGSPIRRDSTH
jgi:hypothetical protein